MNEEIREGMEGIQEMNPEDLEFVTGGKKTIHVKVSECNIRSGPGTDHSVVKVMVRDDKLDYLGKYAYDKHGYCWGQVKAGGQTGWVRRDLVKK